MNLIKFLDLKEWNANHSSVWKEIVSRFGQADYDNETLREKHKATLKAEWDALDFARKRQKEYPSIESLVVALYDADDKAEIDKKRAEIKKKYPKP
ncbi:hypothetical protein [uncultured Mediterranean phage uvMED]|nr:hypothetical protein [uncultured Mediterranean phage uvMED]